VTPGSQQYWLQAFNNVLHGRWEKIEAGYGRAVLGYFGRPPLPPDPGVVKRASEQLEMEPFDGNPLEAAPDTLEPAKKALEERGLETTDENIFLVAAASVPGKDMELNEGIRLLTGKPRIQLPLKKKEAEKPAGAAAAAEAPSAPAPISAPFVTDCEVVEGHVTRHFRITIAPPGAEVSATVASAPAPAAPAPSGGGAAVPVHSPFEGEVEVVKINVKVGDRVDKGQVVAAVEAMKAEHDVKAPTDGTVASVDASVGAMVSGASPILTIQP
jgi:pyruvate carboxylase subunit B